MMPMMGGPGMIAPIGSSMGPAPSTMNVQGAMNPQMATVQSQNRALCGTPAVTPVTPTMGMPGVPGQPMPAAASTACVVGSSSSEAENSTGKYVGYAIGGLFGLITVSAIIQKYKTMGSYSSFWGRMICLLSGAAGLSLAYSDFSAHSANDCDNFFGEALFDSPCPCLLCVYVLGLYALFQFMFNLPFLYANEKTISKMYASFGLFNQAGLVLVVSGGSAGAIKFASGSLMSMAVACVGCLASVMFLLGWFKGEDGVLGRMFQSAKDMLTDASQAAAVMVDDGLKMFGLNADERTKVTLSNVYTFARVARGPDWSAADEDGGPDSSGGEIVGYIGENGVADGVPVSTGGSGWAKVKWDPKIPGQPGKTGEYRIGANGKFELKMVEETEGVVDKLMSQTFGLFGVSPAKTAAKEKLQIEFILTSRLPGEMESEEQADLKDDEADDEEGDKKKIEKLAKAAQAAAAAASRDLLIFACDVFDASGRLTDTCSDVKPMLFKSAIRHRQLGNKQDAIVVELQKLPPTAAILALSVKVPAEKKLGNWETLNVRSTSTGHDIAPLSVSPAEGAGSIASHRGGEGFLWFILYSPEPGQWYAEKVGASLGAGSVGSALADQVSKFLAKREKVEKKKKKNSVVEEPLAKNVAGLVNVIDAFENIKFETRCEEQARELMNTKLTATTNVLVTRLKAQGIPEAQAQLQAKKIALVQINKQHQLMFQKTLIVRRAFYLKQRVHPVHAMILAKKDANRAALYDGKEEDVKRSVRVSMAEEKEAVEEAKRLQDADYANTYTGQASALASSLWSWTAETPEDSSPKKKKKKKKTEENKESEPLAAPAKATPALPAQFANLSPEQLAAIRAMQQRQLAAKQPSS